MGALKSSLSGKRVLILVAMALVLPGLSGVASSVDVRTETLDRWTVALYVDADNNLEACYDQFSDPMLRALTDSDEVDVVAWVDRLSTTGYEVVEFSGEDTTITYEETELGFGLWTTFRDFLLWVEAEYPSENLAVVMWDHGSAWSGLCSDDTDGSRMYGPDLTRALKEAAVEIDVLGFDACSMSSMERMYDVSLAGVADYVVASEELVPGNGFAYDLMFQPVIDDPSRSADDVAGDMVQGWEEYWGQSQRVNLAAIDMDAYAELLTVFRGWVGDMSAGIDELSKAYNRALKHAYASCGTQYQVDIQDFAELLLGELEKGGTTEASVALIDSTRTLVESVEDAVVALSTSAVTRDTHGLTIWWGWHGAWTALSLRYSTIIPFPTDTGWWQFLADFNAA